MAALALALIPVATLFIAACSYFIGHANGVRAEAERTVRQIREGR